MEMRLHRLLPGSLTASGAVIDYYGTLEHGGPCFIPWPIGGRHFSRRITLLNDAGWRIIRDVTMHPGIKPTRDCLCIARVGHPKRISK